MNKLETLSKQLKQQKDLIIYVHGFTASGKATKATALKEYFGESKVFSPSLPNNPDLAIHTLTQNIDLLKPHYNIKLIGSSIGGYYCIYLASKYHFKTVLINPAMEPFETLKRDN